MIDKIKRRIIVKVVFNTPKSVNFKRTVQRRRFKDHYNKHLVFVLYRFSTRGIFRTNIVLTVTSLIKQVKIFHFLVQDPYKNFLSKLWTNFEEKEFFSKESVLQKSMTLFSHFAFGILRFRSKNSPRQP